MIDGIDLAGLRYQLLLPQNGNFEVPRYLGKRECLTAIRIWFHSESLLVATKAYGHQRHGLRKRLSGLEAGCLKADQLTHFC